MKIAFSAKMRCDVLVVGGGGAGIRAALTAWQEGCDTLLLCDGEIGESGSTFYPLSPEWGIMFAEGKQDAEAFYKQILDSAGPCMDPELARLLVQESEACFSKLQKEGLPFLPHRDMGVVGCFGKDARGAVLMDRESAVSSWRKALLNGKGLRVLTEWQVVSVLEHNGQAAGVVAVNRKGELLLAEASAVILATGGGEGLYQHSFSHGPLYGVAYAMAGRHGARMTNLEFIQFINGTVAPVAGLNYYQFAFQEQPLLTNGRGEAFLDRHLPHNVTAEQCVALRARHGPFCMEDDSRFFDLAIVKEHEDGNGFGATVTPNPDRLTGLRYAHWRQFLKKVGFETSTPMTIYPFCQGFNGGIRIRPDMSTDLPGLYACGEAAGGCHGSNRMGGNAILGTQVFGMLAARAACGFHSKRQHVRVEEDVARQCVEKEFDCESARASPQEILHEIKQTMQHHCFLRRSGAGLIQAAGRLSQMSVQPLDWLGKPDVQSAFQARNALDAARLIVVSMLRRKESRGGHYRVDFPQHREEYARLMYTTMEDIQI